ncbi:uncharacterized protein [Halyomorpha halys]|uniref:uncharacterized protein isoform X2 n=1 Tax=Halyomorpha halys TaxID=286706 RepID=UPI0006D4EE48|nr:uncharacterized protein LOC106692369 isoform X2 [Halyomorpha halys]
MRLRHLLSLTIIFLTTEIIGSPFKFPEENKESRSLQTQPNGESEARFHHHKKKKIGCHGHNRFKRQSPQSEGRFFFPILNYYDTDIIVSNGYGDGTGCGSIGGIEKPSILGGKPPLVGLGGLGNIGSGITSGIGNLGSSVGNLGSGLGGLGSDLSSGLGSLFPSIGNGIPGFGSPSQPSRPPAPVVTRPPVTRPPLVVSPPQTTTDSGDDGDSEDYDYTDFSTTVRSRPLQAFTGHRPMPITNPLVNNIKPVFERPERYFNRYVVRPINRTLREFYSLF